ncbi:MFS transporter [Streptomyces sp. NBC_00453]|uniref:MFS transporter n=1 Tax=Streptomyces sp. NBC_00453 TaxID=2903653 RepID=UPI002E1B6162
MASFIDAAAIVGNGTALVLYQDALGLTAGMIGVLSAALTFSIAIGALCGGALGDRYGRHRVFSVTMVVIVLGSALLTFSTAYPALLVGVVLLGLGTGADLPVSLASIAEAASDDNRGALIGLSNVLWVVGITAVTAMTSFAGDMGRLSGQLIYGMVGVISLLVLVARMSIPGSESWLKSRDEHRRQPDTVQTARMSVQALLRGPYSRAFLVLLLFYALTNLAANTAGQFNSYVAVNVADLSVQTYSRIGLIGILLAGQSNAQDLWIGPRLDAKGVPSRVID